MIIVKFWLNMMKMASLLLLIANECMIYMLWMLLGICWCW